MDELCKMLAENLGSALDSTSDWMVCPDAMLLQELIKQVV